VNRARAETFLKRRRGRSCCNTAVLLALVAALANCTEGARATPQETANPEAPVVTKVEPPSWWIGLTPELMLLISGKNLEATHVSCNLPDVLVTHTQATAGGSYLFVWLKFGATLRSGTAVCRVTTPTGNISFELPLASRTPTLGKFQGLTQDDVMYLIMPDRFANGDPTNDEPAEAPGTSDRAKPRAYHGGDLRGIRDHLPYLKELGVTTLWLTPIVKNGEAQSYHGYGAVDLYAVDPHLGTLRDYQELVSAVHQQHMKVFFDVVPNHVGPRHPWVARPPTSEWFHGAREHHLDSSSPLPHSFYGQAERQAIQNDPFESLTDPHLPWQFRRNLTEGWFFGMLPDMNTEDALAVEYLIQNSIWWTEASGLDGFRVDTFPYVSRKFWAQWHAALRKIYPRLTTIGEIYHPDPDVTSFFVGGQKRRDASGVAVDTGLTTVFDYPLYFVLRDVLLHGGPVGRIADILRRDSLYPHPELLIPFFANHDVPRFASAEGSSPEKLALAFGLTATLRGIPEFYYGDEIGMPGGGDPDNRRDFPGGWPGDSQNAFTEAGRTIEQRQIFGTVRALLGLRREHEALRYGKLWDLASDNTAYVFLRETEDERIVVAFNNATVPREMRILTKDTPAQQAAGVSLLLGKAQATVKQHEISITMPAQSLSIFLLE
jgi:glycosidase